MVSRVIWWSINNRLLVLLLAALVFVGGFAYCSGASIDVFPEFSPPQVVITTEAPGLTAEQVESVVTLPLEAALNGTPGVTQVRSASTFGLSTVTVIFKLETALNTARQLVAEKLQLVRQRFGDGIGAPVMMPAVPPIGDILKVGLTSSDLSLMELKTIAEWQFRFRILSVPGVSRVLVFGGDDREYQVLLDPDKLTSYGLTLNDISDAVKRTNQARAAGFFLSKDRQLPICGLMRARDLADLENTIVKVKNGTPILLKHLCKVEIGAAPKISAALINGQPGVYVYVSKQPGVDTLKLTKAVEDVLDDLRREHGGKLHLTTIFRQADFIQESVNNVLVAIYIGAFLVLLVLAVFGINWRLSIVSLVAMPLSLICAMALLRMLGGSINAITLGGLAIAIGEAVDDAVVDGLNVFRRLRENEAVDERKQRRQVIFEACREIRSSVLYSTLMVCLVFMPVFVLPGVEGRIFSPVAVAYILTVISSWFVAVLVTPALCALFWGRTQRITGCSPKGLAFHLEDWYRKALDGVLKHPVSVVVVSACVLAASLTLVPSMGQAFLPEFTQRDLIVTLIGRTGQSLNATTGMGKTVSDNFLRSGKFSAVGAWIGRAHLDDMGGGTSYSEFDVLAKTGKEEDCVDVVRATVEKIPGCLYDVSSFITHRMNEVLSGGTRAAVAIKIFGNDISVLEQLSSRVVAVTKETKGAVDVRVESQIAGPHLVLTVDRSKAARYGLSVGDICDLLEIAFNGTVTSEVLEEQRLFKLRLWFDKRHRNNIELLKRTLIDTSSGQRIPLSEVTEITISDRPAVIVRENVARRVVVQANTKDRDLVGFVNELKEKINSQIELPVGYRIVYAGQYAAQQEASQTMLWACVASIMGILALLKQAVGSWKATFVIASNLPLAAIGGIVGVALGGGILTVGSLIGFVSLFGISTRNAVLLVSQINSLIASGMAVDEAIGRGAVNRFVSVVMTASMAGFGMLPLVILGGAGRDLEQPLAIVIVGGLFSSTVLSIFVIPALYKIFMARSLIAVREESLESPQIFGSHRD